MSEIILETRENYKKYLKDLAKYCPSLISYKTYNSIERYKLQSRGTDEPKIIIFIMSNLFLSEMVVKKIKESNFAHLKKIIIIMDNLSYDDSTDKDREFQIIRSSALANYAYDGKTSENVETLEEYLKSEAGLLHNMIE